MVEFSIHVLRVPENVKEIQLSYIHYDEFGNVKKKGACNTGTILDINPRDSLNITFGNFREYTEEDIKKIPVEPPKEVE